MTVTAPRPLPAVVAALLASGLMAGTVLAHAALVSSSPADGATVAADQVRSVTLTFDDDLDATKSQFELVDAGGTTVATGKVGADPKTMLADGLSLTPGSYQARWTAATADGHITRGIVSFVATADALASASAAATGGPSASPLGGSSAAIASLAPAADPLSAPGASGPADSGSVVAAIIGAAAFIAVVAVLLLRRSRAA